MTIQNSKLTMDNNDKVKSQSFDKLGTKVKSDDEDKQLDGEKREEELKRKAEDLEYKYKRALADYQNLEKRVAEERRDLIRTANKKLVLRLLPVLDTLREAVKHVQNEGLNLSVKQFENVLREEGVEKIETVDRQFDPKFMQCVDVKEGEEGKVIQEARAGYRLGEEVLREALVIVGKKDINKEEEEKAKKELRKGDYM